MEYTFEYYNMYSYRPSEILASNFCVNISLDFLDLNRISSIIFNVNFAEFFKTFSSECGILNP